MYGMNISKNSFTIFSNGSAYVWFFLILGIYYTQALPIYERIFSFNCRFILNLLHSLTPYFLEDLRHVQNKCDQSIKIKHLFISEWISFNYPLNYLAFEIILKMITFND